MRVDVNKCEWDWFFWSMCRQSWRTAPGDASKEVALAVKANSTGDIKDKQMLDYLTNKAQQIRNNK